MTPYTDEQFTNLIESNQQLVTSVESLVRAIHGAPEEGNIGMLPRLHKVEKSVQFYRWLVPFALFGGTATSPLLLKLVS